MKLILVTLFCSVALLSNLLGGILLGHFPLGLFIYPLSFLLTDFAVEFYGAPAARQMVGVALILNLLLLALFPSAHLGIRIAASTLAFLVSQSLDITLYSWLKRRTPLLWLRMQGASWLSQLVDTLLVDTLFFGWGLEMPWDDVAKIMLISYVYKITLSVALTPLYYALCRFAQRQ